MRRLGKLDVPSNLKPHELSSEKRRLSASLNVYPYAMNLCRVIDVNDGFPRKITIGQAPNPLCSLLVS